MDPAHDAPGEAGRGAQPVPAGVAGDIRLEDGDARDAESTRCGNSLCPEQERGCRVHHIRLEVGDQLLHHRVRQADRELPVRDRRHLVHSESRVGRGCASGGNDDYRLVSLGGEVIEHLPHAGGDAVGGGEETLTDNHNSHDCHDAKVT